MTIPNIFNNRDLIIWNFDFSLSTFFEVDTEAVEPLLPSQIRPIEAAPGISLMNITAFNFKEGGLGNLPEFQELILSVIVTPDLSRGVPRFAMYVVSLASTLQDHLDHSADYYKLPIYGKLSDVTIKKDIHDVSYADGEGPILSMKNIQPNPEFAPGERYFQAFVQQDGEIYVADLVIRADLCEHQVKGEAGQLADHPFFRNIDLGDGKPAPYLQMFSRPGTSGAQFYAKPEKFG